MRTLTLGLLACALALASQAGRLYKQGRKAERAGEMARAYLLYSEAAALEPQNPKHWQRSQAVRSRAALQAKPQPKPDTDLPELPPETEPQFDSITERDLAEARKPLPPAELKAPPERLDFDLQGDSKAIFEKVAKAFGLDCVFDGEYQPARNFRFRMQQADYREALHALEAATGSFIVPLASRLFLVAKDTPQKRREIEPYASVSIPLPEPTTAQDFTMLITAVQQSLALEKVSWDSHKNVVVIRDRLSKLLPAQKLFQDLLYPRPQVGLELEFLEMDRSTLLSYGFALPGSFPLLNFAGVLNNQPSIPSGLARVLLFGGGKSLFGLGITDASVFASTTESNARTLLHAELRSVDGQPATFHVGDRYPILTAGYFGPQSFTQGAGQFYRPPPSFNFEDLGLALKITPRVHGLEEVSLEVEAEFKVLAGQSINGIPVISNRKLNSKLRVKNGEWAVVAGMMTATEARTISGLAGLSEVPVLGRLLRRNDKNTESAEVLMLIKPRLLTLPPTEAVTSTVRLGSEQRPLTPL